jgi:uncharacterized protein involved in outer membrane biogenesis
MPIKLTRPRIITAAVALLALGSVLWVGLAPRFMVTEAQDYVLRKTGRSLSVSGAQVTFQPSLALLLSDVVVAGGDGIEKPVLTAERAMLPIDLAGLMAHRLRIEDITLENASITLSVGPHGETSFANPGAEPRDPAKDQKPLRLSFVKSGLSFVDQRSGHGFAAGDLSGRLDLNSSGEITLQGSANLNDQLMSFSSFIGDLTRVANDGSPFDLHAEAAGTALSFNGRLSTRRAVNLAGQASVTAQDLSRSLAWLGIKAKLPESLKEFSASGVADSAGGRFSLRQGEFRLGTMEGQGTLLLEAQAARPKLTADLTLRLLDLSAPGSAADAAGAAAGEWQEKPFDLSFLSGFDASFRIAAFKAALGRISSGPLDISGTLTDGTLTAELSGDDVAGGRAKATLAIAAPTAQTEARHSLVLTVEGAEARALTGSPVLSGPVSLTADLTALGSSEAMLVSSLGGTAEVRLSKAVVRGVDFDNLTRAVARAIVEGWKWSDESSTDISSAGASFRLEDGVATCDDISIEGAEISAEGSGEIDLFRRALDLSLSPRISSGDNEAMLPVQVRITGPWAKPRLYPDIDGILEDPAEAYQALKDMGLPGSAKKVLKKGKKLLKSLSGN